MAESRVADYVYTFGILLNLFTQTLDGFGGLADKRGADYGGFTVIIFKAQACVKIKRLLGNTCLILQIAPNTSSKKQSAFTYRHIPICTAIINACNSAPSLIQFPHFICKSP